METGEGEIMRSGRCAPIHPAGIGLNADPVRVSIQARHRWRRRCGDSADPLLFLHHTENPPFRLDSGVSAPE